MIIFEDITGPLQTIRKHLLSFARLLEFARAWCLETLPQHKMEPLKADLHGTTL